MNEFDDLYRAPRATSLSADAPVHGAQLKWVYAGLVGAGVVAGLLSGGWKPLMFVAVLLWLGGHIVGLAWLARAWREVRRGNAAVIVGGTMPEYIFT